MSTHVTDLTPQLFFSVTMNWSTNWTHEDLCVYVCVCVWVGGWFLSFQVIKHKPVEWAYPRSLPQRTNVQLEFCLHNNDEQFNWNFVFIMMKRRTVTLNISLTLLSSSNFSPFRLSFLVSAFSSMLLFSLFPLSFIAPLNHLKSLHVTRARTWAPGPDEEEERGDIMKTKHIEKEKWRWEI